MPRNQDEIFRVFEGDNYFARNKAALETFDTDQDLPLRLMRLYRLNPRSALEVGAANGYRLAVIAEQNGARVVAVDPSAMAIEAGKKRFPNIHFLRATAADVPLKDVFDLVIVNFVMHWIDRSTLLRSVAEIDRLVADGGFLMIGDFSPSNLLRVPYHHLEQKQVFTYKQNYSAVFIASGLYHLVGELTAEHASGDLSSQVPEQDRTGACLLRKELQNHYVTCSSPSS